MPTRQRKVDKQIKPRARKYFSIEDSESSWFFVVKRRKGYCLYGNESGQIGVACPTIGGAINEEGCGFSCVELARIKTNVNLDELFEIFDSPAFSTCFENAPSFEINDAEVDTASLQSVINWYKKMRENVQKDPERYSSALD